MSKHTPGPWTVGGDTQFMNQVEIWPAIGCAYGNGEEVVANARLIAAAPELLEAIQGLLGPALLGSQDEDDILRDWGELGMSQITRAYAAYAKAKGGTA